MLLSRVLVRGGGATEGRNGEWGSITEARAGTKRTVGSWHGAGATSTQRGPQAPVSHPSAFFFGLSPGSTVTSIYGSSTAVPRKFTSTSSPSLLPTETSLANSTLGYIHTKSERKDSKQKLVSHVQSSIIHASPKVKTTLMSMDGWMDGWITKCSMYKQWIMI